MAGAIQKDLGKPGIGSLRTYWPRLKNRKRKNKMKMDFIVDKQKKTVSITKEFAAELSLVWDAYTQAELLDQCGAPKPMTSRTKAMDFEVGGRRFYAMVSPDGDERWAVQKYTSITPKTNFKLFNAFADKDENLELPGSDWDPEFQQAGREDQG